MATNLKQIYKCNICGNIVEVLHSGEGELVCCGEPMELQVEKTEQDEGLEKHVPVLEKTESGYRVKVGSTPHPMEKKHYIEWIELWADENFYERKFLKPGMAAEVEFCLDYDPEKIEVREYCNIHGLWKN